jgi:hypothetical protein
MIGRSNQLTDIFEDYIKNIEPSDSSPKIKRRADYILSVIKDDILSDEDKLYDIIETYINNKEFYPRVRDKIIRYFPTYYKKLDNLYLKNFDNVSVTYIGPRHGESTIAYTNLNIITELNLKYNKLFVYKIFKLLHGKIVDFLFKDLKFYLTLRVELLNRFKVIKDYYTDKNRDISFNPQYIKIFSLNKLKKDVSNKLDNIDRPVVMSDKFLNNLKTLHQHKLVSDKLYNQYNAELGLNDIGIF